MKERADAEKACKDPNPIIDGRKANVNLAYLGAKPVYIKHNQDIFNRIKRPAYLKRNNVHLAALSGTLQQLPLQAQLQVAALQASAAGRFGFVFGNNWIHTT